MNNVVEKDPGKRVAEVTVGSVTIPIFDSPARIKISKSTSEAGSTETALLKSDYKT